MQMIIRDIPRFYTGIAEWGACMVSIYTLRNRIHGWRLGLTALAALFLQTGFMVVTAGVENDFLWILCMVAAVLLMFATIFSCCAITAADAGFCCARAFILAEFMASLGWRLYCFFWPGAEGPVQVQFPMIIGLYLVIALAAVIMDRQYASEDSLNITGKELFGALFISAVIFFMSNLSFVSSNTPFSGLYDDEIMNIRTIMDMGGVAILYAFYVQRSELRMRRELEVMQTIFKNQYQQYQQSKENMDVLNRRYHDFKHQIAAIRAETDADRKNAYLDEMENDIRTYEAQNKTGNQVLDTLLTSKSLYCARKSIVLTSVVDGKLLDFMYTMDLCSIFGNALDNAIECEERIPDLSKRLIHVSVSRQKGFVLIQVENYIEEELQFQNQLPVTRKMDKSMHGFGMKSMRYAAQKYEGTLTVGVENQWFQLKILIPRPESVDGK